MYCKTYSHIFEAKVIRILCHNEHNVSLSFMKKEISVGEPIIIHSVRVLKSFIFIYEKELEKTEGAIKNGQSRETGNIGCRRHRTKTNNPQTKTMSNTARTKNLS